MKKNMYSRAVFDKPQCLRGFAYPVSGSSL